MSEIYSFSSPCPQWFPFPSTVIQYLIKNPLSPKGHQKLYQTCKYFYSKNPLIFIDWLEWDRLQRNFQTYSINFIVIDFSNIKYKLWLTKQLRVRSITDSTAVSLMLRKVFRCDLSHLCIFNQNIIFNDYQLLTAGGNIKHFEFENVEVRYDNGELVPFEYLLERLPNVVKCAFRYEVLEAYNFSPETTKKMSELPPFEKLGSFQLYDIPLWFDPIFFCQFLEKNHGTFSIGFHPTVSEEMQLVFMEGVMNARKNSQKEVYCETISLETRAQVWVVNKISTLSTIEILVDGMRII